MSGTKKIRILRGYSAFNRVILGGERIRCERVRCYYVVDYTQSAEKSTFGFVVSSRRFSAVQRNRVKRLMKEALSTILLGCDIAQQPRLTAVFQYSGSFANGRPALKEIKLDIENIFQTVITRLKL